MTNYERIKNMSVEEMGDFLANYVQCTIDKYACEWQQWLETEVET